ncbi:MAG TPA: hypothetical protein ENN69_03025, partial [Spirochaetia bacterium]|nr:hypothetical protein [Spirochaetia bacterium]
MTIVVLNGSPKGAQSVTMQYIAWLEKMRPAHRFIRLDAAARIHRLEKDTAVFKEMINTIRGADAVLWAFPVYYLQISSQFKRFIELATERGEESAFRGKPAATFSTSIKFFDHLAHQYLHAVIDDFGMRHEGFYSAHMDDLLNADERGRFLTFCDAFLAAAERDAPLVPRYAKVDFTPPPYQSVVPAVPLDTAGKRIAIIHDARPEDTNLAAMVARIGERFGGKAALYNLRELSFSGCLGCLRCAFDGRCAYEGKDDYIEFFNRVVRGSDILVFAGAVAGRQLSSIWRRFFDRSFFNNHRPVLQHKQIVFLVSGPLSRMPELTRPYEAWMDIQQANLAGVVSDEGAPEVTDRAIDRLTR